MRNLASRKNDFMTMKMGSYVVGTNNMPKAVTFYDTLFKEEGIEQWIAEGRITLWRGQHFVFAVAEPFDGHPATVGNGMMVSFILDSSDAVLKMHAKAIELGGKDEGAPGKRSRDNFAAYVRDLDGNKLCFFTQATSEK